MKILWLDHASRAGRHDKWLHLEFAKYLKRYVTNVFFYAPRMKEVEPQFTPIKYDKKLLMKDIVSKLGIDLIIMDTRSAMFDNYFPVAIYPNHAGKSSCWLPEDFREVKTPKICIEEDYHYEYTDRWYEEMGIRAIFQKHYSQYIRKMVLPVEFFPFSVDTGIFKPQNRQRKNKICLAGTLIDSIYIYRERAIKELAKEGLVDVYKGMEMVGGKYVECLNDYVSHLSGASRYNLSPAKTFEIMASGSVLLTNKFMGIEDMLDEGSYVTYKDDASDVIEKAERILKDKEYVNNINKKAQACIQRRHTHDVRIKEFLKQVEKYL